MSLPGYNKEHRLNNYSPEQHGYQEKYVAFVDILGFSELVRITEADPGMYRKVWEVLSQLQMSRSQEREPELTKDGRVIDWNYINPHMYTFSDTLVFTAYTHEVGFGFLMLAIHNVCGHLLELGILTRGAVVRGKVYDDFRVVFGQGLIDAYMLESTIAHYPRILIAENIHAALPCKHRNLFRRDFDGLLHYDMLRQEPQWTKRYGDVLSDDVTLDAFLRKIRKRLLGGLKRYYKSNASVFSKYYWYAQYFNEVISSSDDLDIEPISLRRVRTLKGDS